jgi:hypothetical protein
VTSQALGISRRHVAERVEDLDLLSDPGQLGDLLASAVRSGDDVPAHAVAECAITSGDVDTTNAFADAYPDLSDVVQRLGSAEHRRTKTTDVTTALVCRRTQTIGRRRPRRGMSSALRLEPDDT